MELVVRDCYPKVWDSAELSMEGTRSVEDQVEPYFGALSASPPTHTPSLQLQRVHLLPVQLLQPVHQLRVAPPLAPKGGDGSLRPLNQLLAAQRGAVLQDLR